ncbi:MAG: hypothetical protein R3E39_28465 [Anaerolineae bacterium]
MGNLFLSRQLNQYLKLSNGGTAVLIDTLMLSLSDHAETLWEKRFAQWFGEHDQHIYGIGTVGFELDEIGWLANSFDRQKQFILKAVDVASNQHRWGDLNYRPADFMTGYIKAFGLMIHLFEETSIKSANSWTHIEGHFELCPKHHVYMHTYGCVICNNMT